MSRPYTGFDKPATKRRAGTEALAGGIVWLTAGKITNLGTLGHRPARGKTTPSVHGTGRAVDLGFSPWKTWPGSSRETMLQVVDWLLANADSLGVELIVDYSYLGGAGGGRGWRCDRGTWKDYRPGQISGGGSSGSRWIHVELSNDAADDPDAILAVLETFELREPVKKPATKKPASRKA